MDPKNVEISRRARAEVDARMADAVAGHAAVLAALDDRGEDSPRAGDLYVVVQASEQPLEWPGRRCWPA